MSKRRQTVPEIEGDLRTSPEGDPASFVVFTQLKPEGPFVYAGWLDAGDEALALFFAREHYGQDQECCRIWVVPREDVAGLHAAHPAGDDAAPDGTFQIFIQPKAGDPHVSAETVEAGTSAEALEIARRDHPDAKGIHSFWVVPCSRIAATDEDDLIWRWTDQGYRLARGYAKEVRAKWQQIRERRALAEYEKEDLTETFESSGVTAVNDDMKPVLADLLLAVADDKLLLGHANSDWTGLAPILEEDIAFSSIAQDEMAHAQALYEFVGDLAGTTADALAFGREPGAYRCASIVEGSDESNWAIAIARQLFCDHFDHLRLQRLAGSAHGDLAALAARLAAEEQVHVDHVDGWVHHLGRGTDESRRRLQEALDRLAPHVPMLFEPVAGQDRLEADGLYPLPAGAMFDAFAGAVCGVVRAAGLTIDLARPDPAETGGRRGLHTPAFAAVLDEMSEVYRLAPGAAW